MTTMQAQPHVSRYMFSTPVFESPETVELTAHAATSRGESRAPTHGEIAHRAYDIYVASNCKPNQCDCNWHLAELQLIRACGAMPRSASPLRP